MAPHDGRDQLWEKSFETYYDSYYEELIASDLIDRWQFLDGLTKILVAFTATGSAVAGWALWSQESFKVLWAVIAGTGAAMSILHSALGVQNRLKNYNKILSHFTCLRIDIETLRQQMQIDPDFPLDEFNSAFKEHRERYKNGTELIKNDLFNTKRLQIRMQDQLNSFLHDQLA